MQSLFQLSQIQAFRISKKRNPDALISKLCVEKISKTKEPIERIQSFIKLKTNKP